MIETNTTATAASRRGWKRSSRCTPNGNCLEALLGKEAIGVRDSKSVDKDVLTFAPSRWTDFLRMITS